MTEKSSQSKVPPPPPKPEDWWEMDYETRTMSEILREWIPELLPWRKKKRKRL